MGNISNKLKHIDSETQNIKSKIYWDLYSPFFKHSVLELIKHIPQQPQVQYDLQRQLDELRIAANKLGLYDAADYLKQSK